MADLTADALEGQSGEPGAATPSSESQEQKGKAAKGQLSDADKKLVADRDRKEQQYQQQIRQYETQLQNQNAYMAQLQKQMDALADKDLDDYGKLQKQIEREQRDKALLLERIRQQEDAQRIQQAKHSDLSKLTTKFGLTNEQYQELWKANDPDEALDMAIEFRDRNKSKRDEDEEERRESNRVDVGGGAASTKQTRQSSSERDAWDSGDPMAFIKARLDAKKKK